jgi:surface polysaccharide O-acyltransferase-like enzyme
MRQEAIATRPIVTTGTRPGAAGPPARRGELDLLRALVVVGLVFFHTAVIFGPGDFVVKASGENRVATVLLGFGATWGMPLLFVISGMGIRYAMRSRDAGMFVRERLRRLGAPLLVGLLTLVPLQVYLGMRRSGQAPSFADFYARFLHVRPRLDFPFVLTAAPGGLFETGHLWFLVCLLAFSLVLAPLFAFLRRPAGTRLVGRLARRLERPGAIFLLALPLAAIEIPLGADIGHSGWNNASYALLLVYGYLAAADERIGAALARHRRPALALAVLLFLATGPVVAVAASHGDPFTGTDLPSLAFRLLKSIDGWLWVVAFLGVGRSRGARRRSAAPEAAEGRDRADAAARLGAYANEAVLPFYVLHETVIVAIAYFILSWPVGGAAQYCLIAIASLAATLLLYDLGVRRSNLTRRLFGMKPVAGTWSPHRRG